MWTSADYFSLEGDGQEAEISGVYMYMLHCPVNQMAKGFNILSVRHGQANDVCSS